MRWPEQLKDYTRYARLLWKFKVTRPNSYLRALSDHSPIRVLDLLPSKPEVILDVGANKGAWTGDYLEILGGDTRFYLFEPIPALCDRLRETHSDSQNVNVFCFALSSSKGTKQFCMADKPEFSSFEEWNADVGSKYFPDVKSTLGSQITVQTETLDNFYREHLSHTLIDLIKLDVQGHELSVFEGGKEALKKTKSILVEWNILHCYASSSDFIRVHEFLTKSDFALASIPFQYRAGKKLVYADALYFNEQL